MKETNICNLTDHTTLYACWKNLDSISKKLETETNETMKCFKNNEMVANPSKFQLKFLSKYKSLEKNITFTGNVIKSSDRVELLGTTLGRNINFRRYIEKIYCKANNKVKVFFQIRKFLNLEQAHILAEAYILSNFRYWPLILKFCSKMSNHLIVNTRYRPIRATYDTQTKLYQELSDIIGKRKIHT